MAVSDDEIGAYNGNLAALIRWPNWSIVGLPDSGWFTLPDSLSNG